MSRASPRGTRGASGVSLVGSSEFRVFCVIDAEDRMAVDAGFVHDPGGFLRLSERRIRLGGHLAQLLGATDERIHEFVPFRLGVGLTLRPAQSILDRLGLLAQL